MSPKNKGNQKALERQFFQPVSFAIGTVIEVNPSGYEYVVRLSNHNSSAAFPCVASVEQTSQLYGSQSNQLLADGTKVWVARIGDDSPFGIIVAAIHELETGETPAGVKSVGQRVTEEGGAWARAHTAMRTRWDETSKMRLFNQQNRPADVLPGDWVRSNDTEGMLALLRYVTAIKASGRCRIDMFGLDDFMRVITDQYEHQSAIGQLRILNDEGQLIYELTGSKFQPELCGSATFDGPNTGFEDQDTVNDNDLDIPVTADTEDVPPQLSRFQVHGGAFADLLQVFLQVPREGDTPIGVAHAAFDQVGTFNVRTAGMIALVNTTSIPVPTRQAAPWNPEGDTGVENAPKVPFTFAEGYEGALNLQVDDALAWEHKLQLQRFDERPADFATPGATAADVPTVDSLPEEVDDAGTTTNQTNQDGAAGLFVLPNGDVVIRNRSGSEIFLGGDDIKVSCGRDLLQQPARRHVNIVGDDYVVRAKRSIDVTSAEADIRMKAEENMQLYSRNSGILIETDSGAAPEDHNFDGSTGEALRSRGIAVVASGSRVTVHGDVIEINALQALFLRATNGLVSLVGRAINGAAQAIRMTGAGRSALVLARNAAALAGSSVAVAGNSVSLFRRNKPALIQFGDPIGQDVKQQVLDQVDQLVDEIDREIELDSIEFAFRTPGDYGTNAEGEVLYQTPWQARNPDNAEEWQEDAVNGSAPWPGQDVSIFVTKQPNLNVDADRNEIPRDNMQPQPGGFDDPTGFEKYTTRQ
jgi:hypothetical protein